MSSFARSPELGVEVEVEGESQVRAVRRAVAILECFTLSRPELNLADISSGAGLSKSTAHRLLGTLQACEMVELDRKTGRYRLGLKAFRLGNVVSKGMELLTQADPLLEWVAKETGESSFLLVADRNRALCLRRFDSTNHVRVLTLEPGTHAVLNCGSAQRVLLAHFPDDRWEEIVTAHVERMTPYSLVGREELRRDRHKIRERGYAVAWEDVTLHACALGAPVRGSTGEVIAAVSISGIVQHFSAERLPGLIHCIMQTGDEISRRLGYLP